MKNQILELDEPTAVHILMTVAKRVENSESEIEWSPEISTALKNEFGDNAPTETAEKGDTARQALLLLSEIPEYQAPLTALINGPKTERFAPDLVTTMAVVTAALIILQTHVRFYRDKKGKWTLKVERKAASESLIEPLIRKILSLTKGS